MILTLNVFDRADVDLLVCLLLSGTGVQFDNTTLQCQVTGNAKIKVIFFARRHKDSRHRVKNENGNGNKITQNNAKERVDLTSTTTNLREPSPPDPSFSDARRPPLFFREPDFTRRNPLLSPTLGTTAHGRQHEGNEGTDGGRERLSVYSKNACSSPQTKLYARLTLARARGFGFCGWMGGTDSFGRRA